MWDCYVLYLPLFSDLFLNMANLKEIAKLLEVEEVDLLRENNIDR